MDHEDITITIVSKKLRQRDDRKNYLCVYIDKPVFFDAGPRHHNVGLGGLITEKELITEVKKIVRIIMEKKPIKAYK
jgi:hypothetical protein